jgi:hypothetical protein
MGEWRFKRRLTRYLPTLLVDQAELWSTVAMQAPGLWAVARNRELYDRHRGQRCFVVGNGPSLKRLDLARLRGETLFTVNTFLDHAGALGLSPFCHTIVDPAYFDPARPTFAQFVATAARLGDALAFFPVDRRAVIAPHVPGARYLMFAGTVETNDNAALTRALPGCYSVNIVALLIALYMGFSEIHLIGCDLDMLSNVVGVAPLRIRESHFYDDAEGVSDWGALGYDYAAYARAVARMFDGFRFAATKARPHQRISNASPAGLLDVFPRVDFTSLF